MTIDINPSDTILRLKEICFVSLTVQTTKLSIFVQVKCGVKVEEQRLVGLGKQLENDKTIQDYGFGNLSNIEMTLRLHGGASLYKIFQPTVRP